MDARARAGVLQVRGSLLQQIQYIRQAQIGLRLDCQCGLMSQAMHHPISLGPRKDGHQKMMRFFLCR